MFGYSTRNAATQFNALQTFLSNISPPPFSNGFLAYSRTRRIAQPSKSTQTHQAHAPKYSTSKKRPLNIFTLIKVSVQIPFMYHKFKKSISPDYIWEYKHPPSWSWFYGVCGRNHWLFVVCDGGKMMEKCGNYVILSSYLHHHVDQVSEFTIADKCRLVLYSWLCLFDCKYWSTWPTWPKHYFFYRLQKNTTHFWLPWPSTALLDMSWFWLCTIIAFHPF